MQVLRQAVDSLAARGTAVVVGAPPFGTEVGLDVNGMLGGKNVVGITLGDSETQTFIPVLAAMVADGRLPVGELSRPTTSPTSSRRSTTSGAA